MLHLSKQNIFLLIFIIIIGPGCQSVAKNIEEKSHSTKGDIFVEAHKADNIPKGYTAIQLELSLKTPEPENIAAGNDESKGKLSILLNIDGQSVVWLADGQREDTVVLDRESGEGIKYQLSKKIAIKDGKHAIFVAIPEMEYATEFYTTIVGSQAFNLTFVPRYNHQSRKWRKETYLAGFRGFEVYLNSKEIDGPAGHKHYLRPGRRSPL